MHGLIADKKEELERICVKYRVHRFELFGSAAGDDFDTDASDLDFLVEFIEMSPGEHAAAYFGLLEALQVLFNRKVDLVEPRAVRNPYFLQAIKSTRILLYVAA